MTSFAVTSVSGILSTLSVDLPSSLTAGHTKVKLPKLAFKGLVVTSQNGLCSGTHLSHLYITTQVYQTLISLITLLKYLIERA